MGPDTRVTTLLLTYCLCFVSLQKRLGTNRGEHVRKDSVLKVKVNDRGMSGLHVRIVAFGPISNTSPISNTPFPKRRERTGGVTSVKNEATGTRMEREGGRNRTVFASCIETRRSVLDTSMRDLSTCAAVVRTDEAVLWHVVLVVSSKSSAGRVGQRSQRLQWARGYAADPVTCLRVILSSQTKVQHLVDVNAGEQSDIQSFK
jgi:hypothetical protein